MNPASQIDDAVGVPFERPLPLGRYRLWWRIAYGATSEVFAASASPFDRDAPLVVKILHPHLAEDPVRREAFVGEIALYRSLQSELAPPLVDADEKAQRPYLVAKRARAGSLDRWLAMKGEPFTAAQACALLFPIVSSLAALNEGGGPGLIHRDIKPANIVIDPDGRVYLSDLGLARQTQSAVATIAGTAKGTPGYMAPEQARGGEVTAAADLFSIGAVLLHLVTGKILYGDFPDPLAAAACGPEPEKLPALDGFGENFAALVRRLLDVDPRGRGSHSAAAAEMARICSEAGLAPGPWPVAKMARSFPTNKVGLNESFGGRKLWLAVIGFNLLFFVSALVFHFSHF